MLSAACKRVIYSLMSFCKKDISYPYDYNDYFASESVNCMHADQVLQ